MKTRNFEANESDFQIARLNACKIEYVEKNGTVPRPEMDTAVRHGRGKPTRPNILAERSFLGHTLISMLVSGRLAEVSPQGHGTREPLIIRWAICIPEPTTSVAISELHHHSAKLPPTLCRWPGRSPSFHLKILDAHRVPPLSPRNLEGGAETSVRQAHTSCTQPSRHSLPTSPPTCLGANVTAVEGRDHVSLIGGTLAGAC